jgi:hypothetical protein
MPAVDVPPGNPGQVDKKAALGRRRTKQEKALAELAFSNPGVKAAVGSRSRSGTEPFPAPPPVQAPPVQAPAAQSTAPASNIATGPGAQQVVTLQMRRASCDCRIHVLNVFVF